MSVYYSADLFVGTYAPVKSNVGKLLSAMVDKHGGTLCPITGRPEVGIDIVGDQMGGGGQWATVQLRKPSLSYSGRDFEIKAPRALELPDVAPIAEALRSIGIDPQTMPPIGWYFAASVS